MRRFCLGMNPALAHEIISVRTTNRLIFWIVLFVAGFFSSYRSYVFSTLHPGILIGNDQVRIEAGFWLLASVLVLWLMLRGNTLTAYLRQWYGQKVLLIFLGLCAASVAWSVAPAVTSFQVIVLVAATWIAAYIGMRCTVVEVARYVSWFAAGVVIGSVYLAVVDPLSPGVQRFYGPDVWRGVFWNRNHLGSIAAFLSVILLIRLIDLRAQPGRAARVFFFAVYLGMLFLVYKSKSTTGLLVAVIAHAACILAALWTIFEKRLRRGHYLLAVAVGILLVALVLGNLEQIFGLFNKDFRLSGRVRLWNHLLDEVVAQRPLLGYGLGSLWSDPVFRQSGKHLIGTPPVIGDNGFIDVLLNLGIVGLTAMVAVFIVAWKRVVQFLIRQKTIASIFPLAVMLCATLSNLTFSLLMEIELLIWCAIVVVLFATSINAELIGTFSTQDNGNRLHQDGKVVP